MWLRSGTSVTHTSSEEPSIRVIARASTLKKAPVTPPRNMKGMKIAMVQRLDPTIEGKISAIAAKRSNPAPWEPDR